jgi:hypothetical protein
MEKIIQVEFFDLSQDKQEEIMMGVTRSIIDRYKKEARNIIIRRNEFFVEQKSKHNITYDQLVLLALNDHYLWEANPEQIDEEFLKDIQRTLEDKAEREAEVICWRAFHYLEIKVEI